MEATREMQTSLRATRHRLIAPAQGPHLPPNISSYFRRPSRVTKTGSRGNSPQNLSRRRTTACHSTPPRHLAVGGPVWNQQTNGVPCKDPAPAIRPISWHPMSVETSHVDYPCQDDAYWTQFPPKPFATAEVHGLITPLTQPSSGDSRRFTPLEQLRSDGLNDWLAPHGQSGYNSTWTSHQQIPGQFSPPESCTSPRFYLAYQQRTLSYQSAPDVYADTAPCSPDFFPAPDNVDFREGKSRLTSGSKEEVLVGMGLYDGPSPVQSSFWLRNSSDLPQRSSTGKGLTLEETFEPPSEGDSDDDDVKHDADESEDEAAGPPFNSTMTFPPAYSCETTATACPPTLLDQSFFF